MFDKELRGHIAAIEDWINECIGKTVSEAGLSKDERKQLQAIENSIKSLSKNGIDIPDDLRRLKLELSARDIDTSGGTLTEEEKAAVTELVDELQKLTTRARNIGKRSKWPGTANPSKQHHRVTLKDLIDGGYISPLDQVEFSYRNGEVSAKGRVTADGHVAIEKGTSVEEFRSLSTASKDISGKSLNGWIYWWKLDQDGSRTLLDEIRKQFLAEKDEK